MARRLERIDRPIKVLTEDIYALSSLRTMLYVAAPRLLPVLFVAAGWLPAGDPIYAATTRLALPFALALLLLGVDLPAVLGIQAAPQTPRYAPVSKVRQ